MNGVSSSNSVITPTTLDEGDSARALFVDFRKAFDLVDYNILIIKLKRSNTPNCLLQWF